MILRSHRTAVEDRLQEAVRILQLLDEGISTAATPVHVITTEPRRILSRTADVASAALWSWIEHSIQQLYVVAGERVDRTHPPGALYGPDLKEDGHETVTVFVPISAPFVEPTGAGVGQIDHLPRMETAVISHIGGFATISDSYRLLGAWVARNATAHETAPVREWYPSLCAGLPRSSDVIAIHWPITTGRT